MPEHNFNTSHVNVNQIGEDITFSIKDNFNTSHVNVNQNVPSLLIITVLISIHLMLMLITQEDLNKIQDFNFNTSHVNVNQI